MSVILIDRIKTPLGPMALLASDGVLLLLEFDDGEGRIARQMKARFGATKPERSANPFGFSDRIRAYFEGELAAIEGIPADGGGSDFETRVWAQLRKIACGTTKSYGDIARSLGDVGLSRAVGLANGRNPIAIVVPCHRVIGADGTLVGYGGGLDRKRWLLRHEGAHFAAEQGDLFSSARGG
ncbi:MAG: methylated-DNA--[protein]-cysteine S-methyltransferase [Rhizobiales bacterium]|nr:methylated-DNA--[protein]-cysteine S-methyltransferase [Hyphomicrobiales bacterium]